MTRDLRQGPATAHGRSGGAGRAPRRHRTLASAALLGASLVFAGCSGGSGPVGQPDTQAIHGPQAPESLSPQDPPASPEGDCITLHDGTCVSEAEFDASAHALALDHADHHQFGSQWGLEAIGAERAYAHVDLLEGDDTAPGAGVTIGFIDTGIDVDHPVFQGKSVSEVFMEDAMDETGAESSHGTAVASVAAGIRAPHLPSFVPHGVAWGADIAMFAIPLGTGDGTYNPVSLDALAAVDAGAAQEFDQVLGWRDSERQVDVLNLSFGYQGIIDDYGEADLRASLPATIAALAQDGASDKAILVWAGGNSNGDSCDPSVPHCETGKLNAVSPSLMAGLAVRIPELRGHTVAVVALAPPDEIAVKPSDETIALFSNRCGLAADFCIAAPGYQLSAAYFGPNADGSAPLRSVDTVSGTSVAAPMVSGGFAIMKQLFRDQLSNEELVTRVLETADDTGVFSDRATYGRGKLDLAAATHPVGVLEVPVGPSADEAGLDLGSTLLTLGAPFGNGGGLAVQGHEVMALDGLDAPFWYRLGDFVAIPQGAAVDTMMPGFLTDSPGRDPWQPGALPLLTRADTQGGHLSLAEGGRMATVATRPGVSASVFSANQRNRNHGTSGGALGWRPAGAPLGLYAGWIAEDETLLGSAGHGAFGALTADTVFVRLEGDVQLGAWQLEAGAERGSVRPQARGGFIEEISTLATSAFALRARAALPNQDRVSVSFSQPLRVESGRASLMLPVARTKSGRIVRASVGAPLAPDARQIDLAVTWEKPLADGPLRLGFVWSRNPNHRASADPRFTFLAGWRRTF